MKTIAALLALCLTGCGSLPSILEKSVPDGSWKTMKATVNGKVSSTHVEGANVVKSGKSITAENLHVRHSNIWVALIEFEGTGYLAPGTPPPNP